MKMRHYPNTIGHTVKI